MLAYILNVLPSQVGNEDAKDIEALKIIHNTVEKMKERSSGK